MRETSNSLVSKENSQQPKHFRGGKTKVMKKKLAAFALASALVIPTAVPAFAATPSDVVGKPVQSAVEELSALGIIQGYEDGTFKPDNAITRAELAKIIVIATGNETAASLMQNVKPSYKDVKANAWYTGYINVATTKGIIQGYNGNYRPSDNVKFEEVVAIIVRALGYQDKYLSGSWPYNVLLQADEIGLFGNIDIATGTLANRGIVAELTSNALGETLVGYDADGNQVDVDKNGKVITTGSPLVPLINKLGSSADKVLTAASLNSDKEVGLNGSREDTAASFFVTGGKKLAGLLGHTVSVLYNKDGDVLAVTDAQDAKNIVVATSDAINDVGDSTYIEVNDGAKEYEALSNLFIYDNTDSQANTYDLANGKEVVLQLNGDGKVQALLVNDWDANILLDEVVAYNDYSRVTTKNGGTFKVVSSSAISLNGEAVALADLKEDDVINVLVNDAGEAINVVATRNVVTGKLESVGLSGSDVTYQVGGKSYVAIQDGDDLTAANIGTEYTYYLNKDGKIVYYATASAVDNSQYAVVYEAPDAPVSRLIDGEVTLPVWYKVVYYSLKDSKKVTAYTKDADVITLDEKLIELKFDGDGNIALTPAQVSAAVNLNAAYEVNEVTATKLTVETGATDMNYVLNSNTIYLKVTVDGADTTVAVGAAADVSKGDEVVVKAEAGVAKYVVVTSDGDAADLPAVNGLLVSTKKVATSATESTYSAFIKVDGEDKEFAIDGDAYTTLNTLTKYDLVKLTDDGVANNALYEDVAHVARTAEAGTLTVDNATKTIVAAGANYVVTADTQIYVTQDTFDSVSVGSFTDLRVAADGTNYGTGANQYKVVVQASGVSYGGIAEAGVIIVKAY
ncbi:S-layer homology domain-containing protein [Paenibacillus arenilitoris]|uniref:S-layer homology domain-containing protein n=1 Tax=Paenibacillus arenilitoris TaxID=2772299 RepID=A0A927CHV9_9BACL|nr:S-layer homology domain-containing protein [Paenibacillus arenilitoris]MBD2868393.1 S-layer homology domain-containing protein [Paenibacillus arenilitoris]